MSRPEADAAPWYVQAFRKEYLQVYPHRDRADARRAVDRCVAELGLSADTLTLDLACGAGRHLELLAEAGVPCVGLDLSLDLLREARAQGIAAPLVRADMRELPFRDASFDRVLNLFSSFAYFESDAEHARMLAELARVLKPGGLALMDHMNPDWVAARLVPQSESRGEGVTVRATRRIDRATARVEKDVELAFDDGRSQRYTESVRLFRADELDRLLRDAGLTPLRRIGDFDGSPFTPASPRQIVVFQRGSI